MNTTFPDMGIGLLCDWGHGNLVDNARKIEAVHADNGEVYLYEVKYGDRMITYLLKPYTPSQIGSGLPKEMVLSHLKSTGVSQIEGVFDSAYLERETEFPSIGGLFRNGHINLEDVAIILADGLNRLHNQGVVYLSPIGEQWCYDLAFGELKIKDLADVHLFNMEHSLVTANEARSGDVVNALGYIRELCGNKPQEVSRLEEAVKEAARWFGIRYTYHQ